MALVGLALKIDISSVTGDNAMANAIAGLVAGGKDKGEAATLVRRAIRITMASTGKELRKRLRSALSLQASQYPHSRYNGAIIGSVTKANPPAAAGPRQSKQSMSVSQLMRSFRSQMRAINKQREQGQQDYPMWGKLATAIRTSFDNNGKVKVGILPWMTSTEWQDAASEMQSGGVVDVKPGGTASSEHRYLAALGIYLKQGRRPSVPARPLFAPVMSEFDLQSYAAARFDKAMYDLQAGTDRGYA